jgi:hypothetical protein
MAKSQLVDLDFGSLARILNLLDPTLAQHPATKAYVDSAVEGLSWKDSVRVSAPANVNLAAPGATIDGVTMAANDRFLAGNQTTGSQNGIYIFNGSGTPATRAPDMSTAAEVEQAVVTVEEGTSAGSTLRQTQVNVTLDTTTLIFTSFGTSAPAATETAAGIAELATQAETDTGTDDLRIITPLKLKNSKLFNQTKVFIIGDGSATSFNCDHNLNTRNVVVTVFRNSGNFDDVEVDKQRPTVNRVTIVTAPTVPAASGFVVVVQGTLA